MKIFCLSLENSGYTGLDVLLLCGAVPDFSHKLGDNFAGVVEK